MISSSNEGGKIVNNYNCYIATILESKEAKEAQIDEKVQLLLSTGDEIKGEVEYIAEQESGNTLIIFKIIPYYFFIPSILIIISFYITVVRC